MFRVRLPQQALILSVGYYELLFFAAAFLASHVHQDLLCDDLYTIEEMHLDPRMLTDFWPTATL